METFFINQKFISFNDKYYIYDINNKPYLEVVANVALSFVDRLFGGIFSLGNKFYIKKLNGDEFAIVKKRQSIILNRYDIYCGEKNIGTIKENYKAVKSSFSIITNEDTYIIDGDIFGKNFTISKNGVIAASIKKSTFNIKDKYQINIFEEENTELFLSIIIIIDNSTHN